MMKMRKRRYKWHRNCTELLSCFSFATLLRGFTITKLEGQIIIQVKIKINKGLGNPLSLHTY